MKGHLFIAIVEDETPAQRAVEFIIEEHCPACTIIGITGDYPEAVDLVKDSRLDLLLLDYQLRGCVGYDVVDAVEEIKFDIVFVSSWADEAYKGMEIEQLDYVLKPVDALELANAVEKIRMHRYPDAFDGDESKVIRTKMGVERIDKKKVYKIIANGSYSEMLCVEEGSSVVSRNLSAFERELGTKVFYRINRSTMINADWVESWDTKERTLKLKNGDKEEISRRRMKDFEEYMIRRLGDD